MMNSDSLINGVGQSLESAQSIKIECTMETTRYSLVDSYRKCTIELLQAIFYAADFVVSDGFDGGVDSVEFEVSPTVTLPKFSDLLESSIRSG